MASQAARPLTLPEVAQLHERNPDPRVRAVIWTGLCTGLRIGEIRLLNVAHVLTPLGDIREEIACGADIILKRGKSRSIPVNPLLRNALNSWCLASGKLHPLAPLFPSPQSDSARLSRRQLMRIVSVAFKNASLDGAVSTHTLRKTFATTIHAKMGRDLAKTQLALAHASPASTVAYLDSCNVEVRNAIRTLYLDSTFPELPFSG